MNNQITKNKKRERGGEEREEQRNAKARRCNGQFLVAITQSLCLCWLSKKKKKKKRADHAMQ